jgi:hypothetical protein
MTCDAVRHGLIDYLDETLSPPEQAVIATHLQRCAACRAEAEALAGAEAMLGILDTLEPPPVSPVAPPWLQVQRRGVTWQWLAASLVLVLLVLMAFWQGGVNRTPSLVVRLPVHPTSPKEKPVITPAPQTDPIPQVIQTTAPPRQRHRLVAHHRRMTEPRLSGQPTPTPEKNVAPDTAIAQAGDPAVQQEQSPVERDLPTPGVVLVLGTPQPISRESRCTVEIAHPDGSSSHQEWATMRDESGRPKEVFVIYTETEPAATAPTEGESNE